MKEWKSFLFAVTNIQDYHHLCIQNKMIILCVYVFWLHVDMHKWWYQFNMFCIKGKYCISASKRHPPLALQCYYYDQSLFRACMPPPQSMATIEQMRTRIKHLGARLWSLMKWKVVVLHEHSNLRKLKSNSKGGISKVPYEVPLWSCSRFGTNHKHGSTWKHIH